MRRALAVLTGTILLIGGGASGARSQTTVAPVYQLQLTGVVDPTIASYVKTGLSDAQNASAAAVLITIDTPGGLDSSMRDITQAILNSQIPVICYVWPSGARAASAGTFILLAGSVAAMAPGTNVGAAHPVGLAGAIEEDKATNDAAAYIRSIAEARGRNADWAEQAVRESVSISAEEALRINVIDLIAPDIPTLLNEVDGTQVPVANGATVTLHTAGAPIQQIEMNPFWGFLHSLLNPNLAFVFFWLGLGLIILEIFVPGGVLGTLGAIMLVISIVAFGMLPVQLVGIALLVASVVFFVLELKHPGVGAPAIGGLICLVAGGLLLFDPTVPSSRVSPWVLVPVAGLMLLFFSFVVRSAMRLRTVPPVATAADMTGREGVVIRRLHPAGVIRIQAEEWTAVSDGARLAKGTPVRVTGMEGLTLHVEPVEEQTPSDADEGSETR